MARRRSLQLIVAGTAALSLTLAACASGGSAGSPGSASAGNASAGSNTSQGPSAPAASNSSSGTGQQSGQGGESSAAGSVTESSAPSSTEESAGSSGASSNASASSSVPALPVECTPEKMQTKKAGTLTIATDQPVYEPWFLDNKPASGKGFESAVAYAVADQLGYGKDQVSWVRASFDSVISPAPKNFDFDINEFSITPDRAKVVDFSSGYYDVAQAVVSVKDSSIAGATSIAELADAHLGAQIGTTSLDVINDVIQPSVKPAAFGENIDAVKALQNGQIDGIVTDLPTATYMSSAQVKNGVLVGQLPTGAQPEQFGLLLEKDSPITSCVSAAVDTLQADGTLAELVDRWLQSLTSVPVLK